MARLLCGTLSALAAFTAATASSLSACAQVASPDDAASHALILATAMPPGETATALTVTRAREWWRARLHVPAAWRGAPAEGRGVTVAVLSTGVDGGHPDLSGNVIRGPDFARTGRKTGNAYWGAEGTAVASLIAGHGHGPGGTDGITGIAPAARILSVQVTLEYNDPLSTSMVLVRRLPAAIARGIRYAVSHGARVIALPLDPGTLGPRASNAATADGSPAERAAVRYALAHNVLLVAPAGDNGASTGIVNFPAAYPGVIAVGSTARDGRLSPFTNTGSYVALTAPGSGTTPVAAGTGAGQSDPAAGLMVAAPGGGYQPLASTDMAAALTAGVAALIRARYPSLTVAEVRQALESGSKRPPAAATAGKAGWGHGELDAAGALSAAAAVAAAHPATARPSPASSATRQRPPGQRATGHQAAGGRTAPAASAARPDPGATIKSLLLDLVIAASIMSAVLIAALAFVQFRRRSSAPSSRARRTAQSGGHARHARTRPTARRSDAGQRSALPPASPIPRATPRAALPPGGAADPRATAPRPMSPRPTTPRTTTPRAALPPSALIAPRAALPPGSGTAPRAALPPSDLNAPRAAFPPGNAIAPRAAFPPDSALPPGDYFTPDSATTPENTPPGTARLPGQPPWDPAPPAPGLAPHRPLAAPPAAAVDLPPWEHSPDYFSSPAPGQDPAPRPGSSTGPMYVWNPGAATGPLPAVNGEDSQ